jgi:hypothetical protein
LIIRFRVQIFNLDTKINTRMKCKINVISRFLIFLCIMIIAYNNFFVRQEIDSDSLSSGNANKIDLNKIKQRIDSNKCSCRSNEQIKITENSVSGETDSINFDVQKNNFSKISYTISRHDFLNSGISCSPFKALRRGPNLKVISYSIFGTNRIYYRYLKSIIKGAKEIYPGWIIRVYHDENLGEKEICELECFKNEDTNKVYDNIDFCNINEIPYESWSPNFLIKTFWRWLPIGDMFVDFILSRDTDSCLIEREKDAVDVWLKSNKLFHLMRGKFSL